LGATVPDRTSAHTTTTKKTKISEGNIEMENLKFLSNSITKFCDQRICEGFYFSVANFAFPSSERPIFEGPATDTAPQRR